MADPAWQSSSPTYGVDVPHRTPTLGSPPGQSPSEICSPTSPSFNNGPPHPQPDGGTTSKDIPLRRPSRRPVPSRGEYSRNAENREFIASSCDQKPVHALAMETPGGPYAEAAAEQVKMQDLIKSIAKKQEDPAYFDWMKQPAAPAAPISRPDPGPTRPEPQAGPSSFGSGSTTSTQPGFTQNPAPPQHQQRPEQQQTGVPDLDQEEYFRNPEYREYVGTCLSGEFTGTFDEYKKEKILRAARVPLEYVRLPVIYTGDGAGYLNSVNITNMNMTNSRIRAHNEALNGPPSGQLALWPLRNHGQAIYTQPMSDYGLIREEFEQIVRTIEAIRMGIKREVNKNKVVGTAALGLVSFGVGWAAFTTGVHKKTRHAIPAVIAYLADVNADLRRRRIPVVWVCKNGPLFGENWEVTVTHSPL